MKCNRIFGRLFALALTLGMAPSLVVPARAAGEGQSPQIIIMSNKFVSTPEDDAAKNNPGLKDELETRFWAYQIFIGDIDEENYDANQDINSLSGIAIENTSEQTAIQWGDSIQTDKQEDLLKALGDDETKASTLGITFALMLETGERYLGQEKINEENYPFGNYAKAYYDPNNWQSSDDSSTTGSDRELTTAGRAALEDAFNEDLKTLTIGQLFTAAYENTTIQVYGARTASMIIADFTPASGNVALAQAFYAIVFAKELDTSSGEAVYKYLKNDSGEANGNDSSSKYEGAYAVSSWNSEYKYWYIGTMNSDHTDRTLPDGYYMIRDAYEERANAEGKASAAYMAGVYGYGTIDPKAEAPTVNKTIVNASANGASRELGETITFRLEGSLPENYFTAYKGYPYIFEDTMAPGLTYGNIIRVYVKVPDANGRFGYLGAKYDYYVVEEAVNVTGGNTGQGYRFSKEEVTSDGETRITVSFPNLQNVKGKKVVDETLWTTEDTVTDPIPVNNRSEVYVVYTATLNEGANITDITASNTGNPNTVVLRYANEPLWDPEASGGSWDENWNDAPKGKVTDAVYLYDFGVQLTVYGKKDDGEAETPTAEPNTGETEEREPLAGAGFALKKVSDSNVQYAILHKAKTPGHNEDDSQGRAEYTYYLAGWVSEDDLYTYLAGDTLTRTTKSWGDQLAANAAINGLTVPDTGDYYTAIITQSDGCVRIVGLDSNSTYYLEEVITPEGWAAVDDISISFTAAHNSSGILTGLTATATNADVESTIMSDGEFQGNYKDYQELVARLIVEQEPADEIVDTGGMGNTLFYIGGCALLIGAALLLIIMNVKKPEKRDR